MNCTNATRQGNANHRSAANIALSMLVVAARCECPIIGQALENNSIIDGCLHQSSQQGLLLIEVIAASQQLM